MFVIDCHVHGTRVLLDWSRIEAMYESAEGSVIDWRCWCGATGRLVGGARSEPRADPRDHAHDARERDDVVIDLVAERTAAHPAGRRPSPGDGVIARHAG